MDPDFTLSVDVVRLLRCPSCRSRLDVTNLEIVCSSRTCGSRFPIIARVPILLNESTSVFAIDDYVARDAMRTLPVQRLLGRASRALPSLYNNPVAARNYARFGRALLASGRRPRVLVVGGSTVGLGMDGVLSMDAMEFVETDVALGPRTQVICDAHDLPFADQAFDGVVVQAVLEHVTDPIRCVEEIHRVLKDDGLVYAETPFMQQVHAGRYDFTRFTHLGHRRLFRRFAEIDSGPVGGPGMVMAWSYEYLLLSFARHWFTRGVLRAVARVTGFWLKYLDRLVARNPGAFDSAPGFYFLGRKSDTMLADRELLRLYRGALTGTQNRGPSER